jgi:3-hydroxybutyrate dehydrogenase
MSKIVLISGASRGIGATIAKGLLSDGYRVVATARKVSDLDDLGDHPSLLKLALDVTSEASVQDCVDRVEQTWGPVEILINNAGIAQSAPLHKTTDEMWAQQIEVNLTGSFRLTRKTLGKMKTLSFGRIIFIASIAGLAGSLYTSAYCASKHGVIGMMRALALEVAGTQGKVTANAICPGFVETDMAYAAIDKIQQSTQRSADDAKKALEAYSPQKRLMQADEILHATRFLISEYAKGVNGQAITVDGGEVMH